MKKRFHLLITLFLISTMLFSCIKEEAELDSDDAMHSSDRLGTSHNTGKNCINCHKFFVGGSVYQKDLNSSYSGALVQLTSQANGAGTVVAKGTTDKNGNIYTANTIKFGTGLYVSVTGATGTKFMSGAITSGACNACHGNSTGRVWAE